MDPHFDGVIFKTHAQELRRRIAFAHPPYVILDVRPAAERGAGSLPSARGIDADSLSALPDGVTRTTEIFVVGRDQTDGVPRQVSQKLRSLGALRVVELPGGVQEWQAAGYALEAGA